MAGNKVGGLRAAKTNGLRYGPDFYRVIGRKGGSAKVPKGFSKMTFEQRAAAGSKGGTISRRGSGTRHYIGPDGEEHEIK